MKSFKTEIYTLDVIRLSAIYGGQLKYGTIDDDCILNMDGDICYRNGERARVLEINGDDYILESEGRFILTKDELTASQIKNLENSMERAIKSAEDRFARRRIGTPEHREMYGDNFGAEGYKYVTAHGVGLSTLPRDVNVLASEEMDNGYVVFWTDRWLDTNELEQYDIKPEGNFERYGADKYDLVNGQVVKNGVTMEKLGNDLIAQGYTQDEVKRILASRKPINSSKRVKDLKEFFSNENYKILGESGGFLFVEILTYEGAVPLNGYSLGGGGAKWCIGWRNSSTYWDKYTEEGCRFVMIICNGDTRMNVAFDVPDSDNRVICQIEGNKVFVWSQDDRELYSGDLKGCPIQIPSLVANSRRAITNANTDGIRAQMAYTLEAVKDFAEGYDDWDGTEAQAVEKVLDAFVSAKSRNDGKIHGNIQAELADWLMGLPMSIAFTYHDILKLGEEWGYLPPVDYNSGEFTRKESQWCDNYWNGIANNILKLARKYKVQTPMPAFNSRRPIKSEMEEPADEEVHMNTEADRRWAEQKELANARRANRK